VIIFPLFKWYVRVAECLPSMYIHGPASDYDEWVGIQITLQLGHLIDGDAI
jgi:hypothetical protein